MSDGMNSPPNPPTMVNDPASVPRRCLLKWLGVAGVAAATTRGRPALARIAGLADAGQPGQDTAPLHRLRRWVMVIDLRRCDGCADESKPPQCTQACIQMRLVPEGMEWIEVYEADLTGGGTQFVPTPCMQCQNAPCVNVCPVGATFATPEGIILIDQQRCIGCRLCMAACPYQRRFFNWGEPVIPLEAMASEYNVESQIPARRGTVMKCDFCGERARQGNLPYCIEACPHKAIYFGDEEEDVATNGEEVVQLSRFLSENNAERLKEDLGTKPSVYFIPGHGEAVGRHPLDPRKPQPVAWSWGTTEPAAEGEVSR